MKTKTTVASGKWQVARAFSRGFCLVTRHPSPVTRSAFTLIEVLVAVTLLSLIVVALMAVFNSTQAAFRAGVTQADILEGGRATMDLIAQDLKEMTPSDGVSNVSTGAVNFYVAVASSPGPLVQALTASSRSRTNVLETIFILSRDNQTWTGTGYVVDTLATASINPLYRFSPTDLPARPDPWQIYTNFIANSALPISQNNTNMSHLMDGVVDFRVRAFDNNGHWMTNTLNFDGGQITTNKNVLFLPTAFGETGFAMFSNTLPASVEIDMATLEDRTLQRAESLPAGRRTLYLQGQAGNVHVFRQSVSIPNVDPSAYQ